MSLHFRFLNGCFFSSPQPGFRRKKACCKLKREMYSVDEDNISQSRGQVRESLADIHPSLETLLGLNSS